jgi:prepilin-type N-terminal cleavage/methylation domain-containing protein
MLPIINLVNIKIMTKNQKKRITNLGFTLIELLIALVVMGGITVTASKILFNMVSYRSKQFAIEDTSSSFRDFITNFSREVKGGSVVIVDDKNVEIAYDGNCIAYQISSGDKSIAKSVTPGSACTSGFSVILQDNIIVDDVYSKFSGSSDIVSMEISGQYKDSLTETPFRFRTSVKPRI